ncbi:MAG: SDR family NAD(P)-dependent oxidoreductase [Eubacterium sp.]|nr:SDR family NAD(P)-dependent oxidoreductase [Eubacterium sp.]MBR1773168.1 SDR family NAD(P)-dependent oxidoreductase [Eubacterium sp.]
MNDSYALVTGASSGLGFEFAKQLSERGYKLILVARRRERLEQVQKAIRTQSIIIDADLSKRDECVRVITETIDLNIDVFINNAGLGDCGRFYETDANKDLQIIDVNVTGMHLLLKMMLQKLKSSKATGGYILNVASSAGLFPAGPYMATYYASKAYVSSITQAIARELKEEGSDIYVGCLCPGPVDTEFNEVANVEFALRGISADDCVTYALKQMFNKRKVVIVPTLRMKLAVWGTRLLPREQVVAMTAGQQKKKIDI